VALVLATPDVPSEQGRSFRVVGEAGKWRCSCAAGGADPALGERVRPGGTHRGADDAHAPRGEHSVKRRHERRVAIAAGLHVQEEQHRQRLEADRLDREEVAGQEARCVRPQEGRPGEPRPARRGRDAMPPQERLDGGRRDRVPQLEQLVAISNVSEFRQRVVPEGM